MININDFDDDCLLTIFGFVPLQQIVHSVGCVCTRWKVMQMKICSRQRSLTILIGKDPLKSITRSQFYIPFIDKLDDGFLDPSFYSINKLDPHLSRLTYSNLGPRLVCQLVAAFPQINSLKIVMREVQPICLHHLANLLNQWRSTLECLKVWYKKSGLNCFMLKGTNQNANDLYDDLYDAYYQNVFGVWHTYDHECEDLFNVIDKLTSLKCLLVETPNLLYYDHLKSTDKYLRVLEQLEQFYFSQHKSQIDWFEKRFKSNNNLTRIGLAKNLTLPNMQNLDTELVSKFTHFTIGEDNLKVDRFDEFCNKFNHLQTLSLRVAESLTFDEISRCLTKLPRLIHLRLYLESVQALDQPFEPNWFENYETDHQLASIRILSLDCRLSNHVDFHVFQHSERLFPNLQYIQIRHCSYYRCLACENACYETECTAERKTITIECIKSLIKFFSRECNENLPKIVVLNRDEEVQFDSENGFHSNDKLTRVLWAKETTMKKRQTFKQKILEFFGY